MTSIRRIKIDNNTYELRDARGSQLYVGTCSTAAATNPKVCTVEEFPVDENNKPFTGTEIVVKFTTTNTSTSTTPELNVNGTGAIRIWYDNAVLASAKSAYAGYANRYLHYVYDGTYWVFMGHSVDNNSTYTNVALGQGYAIQNNSAASTAINATLASYDLTANGIVSVKFNYDVPANATLNINGKGAKAIYNKDAAITSGVIKAGDTATFIYNTYYRLIAVDSWQDKQNAISDLSAIRSGAALGATALQSYTETDPTVPAWAKQSTKPSYTASEISGLAAVAKSGNYNDLSNKPTIPAAITVDSTITQNGTNPVQGSAIYSALAEKIETEHLSFEYDDVENTFTFYNSDGDTITDSEFRDICNTKYVFLHDNGNGVPLIPTEQSYNAWKFYGTIGVTDVVCVGLYWSSQNRIDGYYEYDTLVLDTRKINNKPLSTDITLTASDVGAVPTTRTVNGKALSSNITLSASDIGALPSSTHIPADQVQSNWNETNTSSKAYIQNKPTIPAAQVNSDWDASSGVAQILNKPTFKTINGESILGSGNVTVQGEQGPAGTIAVGSVSSGTSASVTNSGTASSAVLDFVLPKGAKGDKGDKGDTGASGVHVGDTVIEQTTGTSTTSLMSQKAVTDAIYELDRRMPTSISGRNIISYNVADYPLLNPALSDGITFIYDKQVTGSYVFYDLLSLESLDQRNYFRISVTGWQYKIVTKVNGGSENTQTLNPGAAAINGNKVFIATTINFKTGEIKFYSDGVYMSTVSFDTSKLPDFELVERVTMSSDGNKIRFLGVCSAILTDEQNKSIYSNYPNDVFTDEHTSLMFGVNEIDLGTGSSVMNGVTCTYYSNYIDVFTTSDSFSNCYVTGRRNYITGDDAKRNIVYRMHITVTEGTPHLYGIGINGRHKCVVYNSNGDVVSSAGGCDLPVGEYDLEFVGRVLSNGYLINFSRTGVCKFRISDVTVQHCGAALILSPYNLRGNKFVQPNGDEIEGTSSLEVFYDIYKPEIVFSGNAPAYNGQIKCEGGHVYFGYVTEGLNVWKRLDN